MQHGTWTAASIRVAMCHRQSPERVRHSTTKCVNNPSSIAVLMLIAAPEGLVGLRFSFGGTDADVLQQMLIELRDALTRAVAPPG